MVKSGLIDNPDVSHYRLALHLTFAFITFAYTLWVALDLIYPERVKIEKTLRTIARFALVFLIVQIIYGGFVAGLNAGLIHNHWPLMSDGQLFHESILLEKESWILRFTEGKSGVQFIHRTLAYLVVGCIVFLYFKGRKHMLSLAQKRGLRMLLLLVLIQFILGVLTLLLGVPMWLGLTHQIMAFLLLATMTFTLHRLSK
jgi:cytochrome c oxidase assembly protein subunit 15